MNCESCDGTGQGPARVITPGCPGRSEGDWIDGPDCRDCGGTGIARLPAPARVPQDIALHAASGREALDYDALVRADAVTVAPPRTP